MLQPITRRQWLGGALAAGAAFTIIPRHVLGGPKFVAPSEKVNIAVVGVGGQGEFKGSGTFIGTGHRRSLCRDGRV